MPLILAYVYSFSNSEYSNKNISTPIQTITYYVYAVNLSYNDNEDDEKYLRNFGNTLVIEEADFLDFFATIRPESVWL